MAPEVSAQHFRWSAIEHDQIDYHISREQSGDFDVCDGQNRFDFCVIAVSVASPAINRSSLRVSLAATVQVEGM